jgi:hypothetical protein
MTALSFFVPIFAFLLIFIIVFALLKKTSILGEGDGIPLLVSFIIATFFILEASLINLVTLSSSWISVFVIVIFFVIAIIGFLPGKEPLEFLAKGKWFAGIVLAIIIGIFIFSAVHVFNRIISWDFASRWLGSDWVGVVILILLGFGIYFAVTRGK